MEHINNLSLAFVQGLVNGIYDAVTDDIILDTRNANLDRQCMNSYPSRVWDLINRNILSSFKTNDSIVAHCTSRGPWKLIAIFDKISGLLFTIMREERFFCIKNDRKNAHHYIALLAQMFNIALPKGQQTLFDYESDENEVKKSVERICDDLFISPDMVKHHAIVLFSAKNEVLNSIRCIMINRNFEECESVSWNKFINVNESTIVPQIDTNDNQAYNSPNRGLKLTAKAKIKQGQKSKISYKATDDEEAAE